MKGDPITRGSSLRPSRACSCLHYQTRQFLQSTLVFCTFVCNSGLTLRLVRPRADPVTAMWVIGSGAYIRTQPSLVPSQPLFPSAPIFPVCVECALTRLLSCLLLTVLPLPLTVYKRRVHCCGATRRVPSSSSTTSTIHGHSSPHSFCTDLYACWSYRRLPSSHLSFSFLRYFVAITTRCVATACLIAHLTDSRQCLCFRPHLRSLGVLSTLVATMSLLGKHPQPR